MPTERGISGVARESPGHLVVAGAGVTLADRRNDIDIPMKALAVEAKTATDPIRPFTVLEYQWQVSVCCCRSLQV